MLKFYEVINIVHFDFYNLTLYRMTFQNIPHNYYTIIDCRALWQCISLLQLHRQYLAYIFLEEYGFEIPMKTKPINIWNMQQYNLFGLLYPNQALRNADDVRVIFCMQLFT